MKTTTTGRFGGALDQTLEDVVEAGPTTISIADAGTRETFLDAWVQTLSEHAHYLRSNGKTLPAPVVVAYVEDSGAFGREHAWNRRRTFGASHIEEFAGFLAAGTSQVGAFVLPTTLPTMKAFENEILKAGLERAPAVALASETKLLIWAEGIDSESMFERDLLSVAVIVDLESIDRKLTNFYEEVARQNKRWWRDASSRVTIEKPEGAVQYDLWIYLMGSFSGAARIKMEETSGNGRTDLTAIPIHGGTTGQSAVLELKVLRDVRTPDVEGTTPIKISKKTNEEWACAGIQQAAAYRDHEKLDGAFLCLYDFRAGNSNAIEDVVKVQAAKYNVEHRRYWITTSHEEHRKDRYPLDKTGF